MVLIVEAEYGPPTIALPLIEMDNMIEVES
jgi:hypothetical protein